MSIKEVEKKLNISRANIRFYEKEGLLEPKRNDNEYRNYSESDLKRLEQIILFRKCNVSIEDIRLIFNGVKNSNEVFLKQISVIDSEVKKLEGAKIICKKLSEEKNSLENIDTKKYFNMIDDEEEKGNKFYNIAHDYIFATEKLYESIIENKNFKKGEKMKKKIKVLIYLASFILTILFLTLFSYITSKSIKLDEIIIFAGILFAADLIGVKKYIENKSNEKFSKKDNVNHFIIVMIMMIIILIGYLSIKSVFEFKNKPNDAIIELSVKKSLIDITSEKYEKTDNSIYAEAHKIISYEVKNNKIYVYVNAKYGLLNKDTCEKENINDNMLTLIYLKDKNNKGVYLLERYIDGVTSNIKNKVKYDDKSFEKQLNSYCNN